MSSLLEQAIIDAKTLKETALRNAEAQILEQYSEEIKQSVHALLEQDEAVGDTSGADLGLTTSPDAPAAEGADKATGAVKRVMNKVEPAYLNEDGLQEIEINLDSLVEKVSKMEDEISNISPAAQFSSGPVIPQTVSRMPQDVTPLEESFEVDEDILEEQETSASKEQADVTAAQAALSNAQKRLSDKQAREAEEKRRKEAAEEAAKKAVAQAGAGTAGIRESTLEEEFALDEELMMDMSNVKLGGVNAYRAELEKQHDIEKALLAQKEELEDSLKQKAEETEKLEETLKIALEQLQATKNKYAKAVQVSTELKEGIQYLSKKFEEANILNARLLYTNKTLGNPSLNERQKEQIAESISKASSVEQAKTIYETLQKSAAVPTERKNAPKSLTEALSKAPSPFLPRKQTQSDSTADRWKLLAGIKK